MRLLEILNRVADTITAQEERLNRLDAVMGDGEHGSNMKKCFRTVQENLSLWENETETDILKKAGSKLLTAGGGTATTLIGFFLRKTAENLNEEYIYDPKHVADALNYALDAVSEKSKAKMGDKTMMDALIPCIHAFSEMIENGESAAKATEKAAAAAKTGAAATAGMVGKRGRGLYVGERGIGTEDPGAVSISLIAETVSSCISTECTAE